MATTRLLVDLADKFAGKWIEGFGGWLVGEGGAKAYSESLSHTLERSKAGKMMSEYLQKEYEQGTRKMGQASLEALIQSGVKPQQAADDVGKSMFKASRTKYMGKHDEAIIATVRAATKEKGLMYGNSVADALSVYFHDARSFWRQAKLRPNPIASKIPSLAEGGISKESHYSSVNYYESGLRQAISWMYTPLIAIPHTGQFVNIALQNVNTPVKAIAKGMAEYISSLGEYSKVMSDLKITPKSAFIRDLMHSGALFDEIRFNMLNSEQGFIRKLVNHPGFSTVRTHEIAVAAAIGKHAAQEAAERASIGDKWGLHYLKKVGIDLNKVKEQGYKLLPEDLERAMYQSAEETIFFRGRLHTPYGWHQNFISRMGSQYKDFIFRQTKFLKDSFKDSYEAGGKTGALKWMLTFGTLFPVFGEMIHTTENLAEGRHPFDRDPKKQMFSNEYFDSISQAAGLGIMYQLWRAAQWDGGKSVFVSPLASTIADLGINIPYSISKGKYNKAARIAISKMSWPGKAVAEQMKPEK